MLVRIANISLIIKYSRLLLHHNQLITSKLYTCCIFYRLNTNLLIINILYFLHRKIDMSANHQ